MGAANDIHNIRLTSSFVTGAACQGGSLDFPKHNPLARKQLYEFRDLGFINYSGSSIEVHNALLSVLLNDKPQIRRDDATDAE